MYSDKRPRRLKTFRNAAIYYSDANITESTFRWLRFNGEENDFNKCVVCIGRKLLIDLDLFEEWMDEQANKGGEQ